MSPGLRRTAGTGPVRSGRAGCLAVRGVGGRTAVAYAMSVRLVTLSSEAHGCVAGFEDAGEQ